MIDFSPVIQQLSRSDLISAALHSLKEAEAEVLFNIALHKDQIFRQKRDHFKAHPIKKILICANETNLGHTSNKIGNFEILHIDQSDLSNASNIDNIKFLLESSILLMTNNIFASIGPGIFSKIFQETPNTIYVIHDYDNHHWLENSAQIALLSDIYVPAHQGDYLISGRLNPNILGAIPCGTNQWSKKFIAENKERIFKITRKEEPLGKYFYYEKFLHRNKTIGALGSHYSTISIINHNFHKLTEIEKWAEWSQYKLHWIIPVLNDLPIRFFDALITGGIPMVPSTLVPQLNSLGIPTEFYLTYGPIDILEPKNLVQRGLLVFDQLGNDGMKKRHQHCLDNFHVDVICQKIIEEAIRLYS